MQLDQQACLQCSVSVHVQLPGNSSYADFYAL